MQNFLINNIKNLEIKETSVDDLMVDTTPRVYGVKTKNDEVLNCRKVVITTGTFLRGVVHIGKEKYSAGRHIRNSSDVEPPSIGLALTLEKFQFPLGRLTTGTPPRLDGRTIDYKGLEEQFSDEKITFFSYEHQYGDFKAPNKLVVIIFSNIYNL